ncbi:PAAR-like protein [Apibacter adventoris]|uniref:PAAR-like protein n=1 Tax=Apibacter adventoris TaxID=1679466 RepID=UPI000CF6A6B1|nr:PAAR-like protein [Apibacter adventoris]PQL92579.1 hypothetical protein C4S76_10935 [Apibacter adventoris]
MSKKKYIPDNSWLTCDKGANPIKIKVTHNNNSYIYGEKLVSEMDMVPGENVDSFGSCSLCGSCAFDPVYWDKCNQGVKVNSYKLVFEDANLLCKKGVLQKADIFLETYVNQWYSVSNAHQIQIIEENTRERKEKDTQRLAAKPNIFLDSLWKENSKGFFIKESLNKK